jgi:hypothetical protein
MRAKDAETVAAMPSNTRPRIGHLDAWLAELTHEGQKGKYWHRRLKENYTSRKLVLNDINVYFKGNCRDSIHWIRSVIGNSLDPLGERSLQDPILKYPCNDRFKVQDPATTRGPQHSRAKAQGAASHR